MADYAQRLRTAGLRVTRPRVAVLHAVHTNPHSDTETITRAVRAGLPQASRQAVYDILHALLTWVCCDGFSPRVLLGATRLGWATTTIMWSAGRVGRLQMSTVPSVRKPA